MAGTKSFTIYTKFAVKNGFTGPVLAMAKTADKLSASWAGIKKFGKGMADDIKKVGKAALWTGAAFAGASVAAWKLIDASQQSADDIQNTANALGISTDALQEYRYVGIQAGLTTEDMDGALTKLTKNLAAGGQATDDALYQIGLSTEQVRAAGPDKMLETIADGFKATKDPQVKAAVAMALFGKSSVRMVNALDQGADGVKDFRQQAEKLGYVMKGDTIENAGDLNDKLDKLGATTKGLGYRITAGAIPAVSKLVDKIQDGIQPGGKYEELVGMISDGVSGLAKFAGNALDFFENLAPAVKKAADDLAPFVDGVGKIMDALATGLGGKKKDIFWSPGAHGGLVDSAAQGDFSGLNGMSQADLQDLLQQTRDVQAGNKGAFGGGTGILEQANMPYILSLQKELMARTSAGATPVSPQAGMISRSETLSRSTLDVNVAAPPGTTSKLTGNAPGITLNTGSAKKAP
jgi:hypothetical protein